MKNNETYCPRYLYLSPINFSDLTSLGNELQFDIKLLVAYPKTSCKAVYVDDTNESEAFKHLNRKATMQEIIDVLRTYQLILYEFILETDGIRIESVTGSDVLLTLVGHNNIEEQVISKIMDAWELPHVMYSKRNVKSIKSNTLFEISKKTGRPKALKKMKNISELIEHLLQEQQDEVASSNKFEFKHRIYYQN